MRCLSMAEAAITGRQEINDIRRSSCIAPAVRAELMLQNGVVMINAFANPVVFIFVGLICVSDYVTYAVV